MSPPESAPITTLEVNYPAKLGRIGLRGSGAPLSWDRTYPADEVDGDRSLFHLPIQRGEIVEFKLVRNDDEWAAGRNYAVHAGDDMVIQPCFDSRSSRLEGPHTLDVPGGDPLTYEVLLPPSYEEQARRRYPVVYAQDGQALFSTSNDPFGVWHLDTELDRLYELGAIDELIIVAIHTGLGRADKLTPMPDPHHGGGKGKAHLDAIVNTLRPAINDHYRTRTGRRNTGLLGSSLGGLFSFYAAWERADVFGKAACLSSSFWWANRAVVRHVQRNNSPSPKPMIYIDSGAPLHDTEKNPSLKDGFQHTRSMYRALIDHQYTPGIDLHWLVFTNSPHEPAAWRARVAVPMQLMFPPKVRRPDEQD